MARQSELSGLFAMIVKVPAVATLRTTAGVRVVAQVLAVAGLLAVAGCDAGDRTAGQSMSPTPATLPASPGTRPAVGGAAAVAIPVTPGPTSPPTLTPDPFAARGLPVWLEIPAIGVDAGLEATEFTPEGAIGAPKDWDKAAWHAPGFRPGEAGNALIAGHLDNDKGGPAVFWDLNELAAGDEVRVTYANGDRFTFVVDDSQLFDRDAQDAATFDHILGPTDDPHLNLMTCDGAWDHGAATYSKRLVVFTRLVPDPPPDATPSPTRDG